MWLHRSGVHLLLISVSISSIFSIDWILSSHLPHPFICEYLSWYKLVYLLRVIHCAAISISFNSPISATPVAIAPHVAFSLSRFHKMIYYDLRGLYSYRHSTCISSCISFTHRSPSNAFQAWFHDVFALAVSSMSTHYNSHLYFFPTYAGGAPFTPPSTCVHTRRTSGDPPGPLLA